MRAVAQEAGCTIGLINHWFSSRNDLVKATFDRAIEMELERGAVLTRDPPDYVEAASEFLPLDDERRDEVKIWVAFWAMVVCDEAYEGRGADRYVAVRETMVEMLGQKRPIPACHDIVDRCFALVDGIAINALMDPARWTPARQLSVLREGLEDALARY